jgi:hypothetical protein
LLIYNRPLDLLYNLVMAVPPIDIVSVNKTPASAASPVNQLLKTLGLDDAIVHVDNAPSEVSAH